ncbi:MAG TPA: sirohydrochlorin cobaltochelatase [Clostridia bacterium]|nr:sirohydrochlorin cobaltochelatase [Clostridia bacterium]
MKKLSAMLLAILMLGTVTACGGASKPASVSTAPESDASESAPAADTGKKAILVVSFGTSYNESRAATIGAVEAAITDAFKDFEVRRAFTSQIIIDKIKSRDNEQIDNVEEAMNRLVADGVKTLVVQPTHVMNGFEYDQMVEAVTPFTDKFDTLSIGKPLLTSDADYAELANILVAETATYNVDKTAVVFMGHGTEHPANATYSKLDGILKAMSNIKNYHIGTVEATPSLEDVMTEVAKTDATRVVLLPMMIVAGDHANNDMAGDEEDSWKTKFKGEGYEVECVIKGLGEYTGIQKMFVEHTQDAIDALGK